MTTGDKLVAIVWPISVSLEDISSMRYTSDKLPLLIRLMMEQNPKDIEVFEYFDNLAATSDGWYGVFWRSMLKGGEEIEIKLIPVNIIDH